MEAIILTLVLMIVAGLVGALTRVLIKWGSDGKWPGQDPETPLFGTWWVQLLLGCIAGWITWEIPNYLPDLPNLGRLGAWALGFVFPDVAENLAEVWSKFTNKGG